ncbi:DUF3800 domain-containing protein [Dactylosporangium sp. NPDC000521]|uniref:DUF3800 domain-containing protein n=1 Tax=Dactylosporangium sp. NPDC000521 TaxID=3363975 RepID=UPI0036BFD672
MVTTCNFAVFYVDDSGSENAGYTTFTWIRVNPAHWAAATSRWLGFRATLRQRHGIPASVRLHATELAGGRGRTAHEHAWRPGRTGLAIIRAGLDAIATLPGITIGTAYRRTTARGRAFEADKQSLYQRLTATLNTALDDEDAYGTVVMDGDGTNTGYTQGHRSLPRQGRRLIEDPFFRHASASQWVQIADFAAWSAYRSLNATERRARTASWYEQILGRLDVNGGPIPL